MVYVDKWYFGKIGKKIAEQVAKKYDGKVTDFGRGDGCWAAILPIDPTGLSELKSKTKNGPQKEFVRSRKSPTY